MLLWLMLSPLPVWSDTDRQALAQHPAWQALLHYQPASAGVASEISDPAFFLAADGRHNARAELDASLQAFNHDASLRCRFPARWQWLQRQLNLTTPPVPAACSELESWKLRINASGITLLFPAMYLHNPASMFGHVFLRFDQAGKSPLLAYTLSYAAHSDHSDIMPVFVYKGLTGGYPGVLSLQPYYQTISRYGDIEQRDIWEYTLNLQPEEIDQLLNHVWELRELHIDYYFLDENCAYALLALLDVARPGMQLTRKHDDVYVIPVDVVRSVESAHLISQASYRPARGSRVAQMYAQLTPDQQARALALADGKQVDLMRADGAEDQAKVLELAAEIRQLRLEDDALTQQLLQYRSELNTGAEALFEFGNTPPQQSHLSSRWQLATGEAEHSAYIEIGLRPALHDWMDNADGMIEGASLEILDMRLRYDTEAEKVSLQQMRFFHLQSYMPVQPWTAPLSTELDIGIQRLWLDETRDTHSFNLRAGAGYSAKYSVIHLYALANVMAEVADEREHVSRVFAGVHAGLHSQAPYGRSLLDALWLESAGAVDDTRQEWRLCYQINLARHHTLGLEYAHWRNDTFGREDIRLVYGRFF